MFSWITLLPALYIGGRFILPLPLPFILRLLFFIAVVLVAECHLVYKIVFGNRFAPEFPHGLMVAINFLFGTLIAFTLLLILCDIVSVGQFALHGTWPEHRTTHYILLVIALAIAGYATYQAVKVPRVKTVTLTIQNLPKAFDGYRVVQLTDLHASTLFTGRWMKKVVDRTNQLHADIVLFTGDVADGSIEKRYEDVAPLAELKAKQGRFAIPGNHEYYSGYLPWMERMEQLGFHELINSSVTVEKEGSKLSIAGVTDEAALRYDQAGPDLNLALTGVDRQSPIILLDHRPENARENLAQGVDLQLSGHTHGGMVYGLATIVKRANQGFSSGLYPIGQGYLYVSNGTGLWNGFALRLGYPSEITLFILKSDKA
ncbi:metallophosphoesterase [Tatumella ptyseos]|uniref:metallophosphoesterase n=1 Tax=Tatumella ptyseos TaxID=82987 RepID=UPI0026ECB73B|nr:metallophosphoesterase [Tatumella ptyseos]WKX26939.1 metallophosphoesterase [Tatumella ptyseos]